MANGWTLLLDRQEAERDDRRLIYRLRNARLRHPDTCIEDVDYRASRRLDKALFQQLARGKWIASKQNLIVTGPCGVGKSWLACALGHKACRDDFSVLCKRVPGMFVEFETGRAGIRPNTASQRMRGTGSCWPRRQGGACGGSIPRTKCGGRVALGDSNVGGGYDVPYRLPRAMT